MRTLTLVAFAQVPPKVHVGGQHMGPSPPQPLLLTLRHTLIYSIQFNYSICIIIMNKNRVLQREKRVK